MQGSVVSIIVPVYKVEQYLDRCVQSIVNQTHKNIEIILVDDGSPDNCPAMCDDWAAKDSRIRVIHKENGGLSSARNAGLEMATGAFLQFTDSDDWLEPEMIAYLIDLAEQMKLMLSVVDILKATRQMSRITLWANRGVCNRMSQTKSST